ncbi:MULTISPECIES: SMI1/KNR4 family protein [Priestia]|uniref:SMI1/KNR4 family protein n=1 Tax=Priestia TaxID=2800373 RepID=UPI0028773F50|nr:MULTISPECIES: SMI1/KNR4 family protein [Priestia]MBX4162504.1 SMI1/KNR4 family protein [Priestia megaterium]MED3896418.1 SMI1/KNR4 family protein [Priestia aryabhattai]
MRKDLEWEYADREVSENEVEESGRQLGFHLPKDYIDCVKINGGASVLPEEFNVGNVELCFGSLFSFDKKSSEYIVQKYELYRPMLPKKVFPIANDPARNLICLDYKNNIDNPIVVFWEHENVPEKEVLMEEKGLIEEQVEERARSNVFYIADTFTDFLSELYD